jgi:formylaminopyrimidine deformylase / aminopyrimidine aminohydrolase
VTALWAIERAYLEAWQAAAPGHRKDRPFIEHWTTPAFEYVAGLERAADAAQASSSDQQACEAAFLEVARLERTFWDMAIEAA